MTKTTMRRLRRGVATVVAVAALVAGTAGPAGADATTSDALVFVPYNGQTFTVWRNGNVVQPTRFSAAQSFPGDFTTAPGSDVFLYNPGSGPDGIFHVTPSGTTSTTSFASRTVNGTFQPIVGDFDGNGLDDIFWYAKGTAGDALWLSKAAGGYTSVSVTVNGTFRPLAVHTDGDGYEDIIWYAPGTAADAIWRFGPGGSHTSTSISINGDYQLIPGHFGPAAEGSPQQRVVFYNKAGADSIWTFQSGGGHTSATLPNIEGTAKPVVGYFLSKTTQQILFYRGGPPTERLLGFTDAGAPELLDAPNVSGNYDPVVLDADGNEYSDIAWTSGGKASIWRFNGTSYTVQTVTTNTTNTIGRATYYFPPIG